MKFVKCIKFMSNVKLVLDMADGSAGAWYEHWPRGRHIAPLVASPHLTFGCVSATHLLGCG